MLQYYAQARFVYNNRFATQQRLLHAYMNRSYEYYLNADVNALFQTINKDIPHVFELLQEDRPNILTIHAEAEGGKCNDMFNAFLDRAINAGWTFKTLGELAAEAGKSSEVPLERILPLPFPGREGWLAVQSKLEPQAGKGEL